jgi:hypothetical protein
LHPPKLNQKTNKQIKIFFSLLKKKKNVLVEKINRFQFSFLKINPFLSHFYTTAPPAHTQQDTAGCRDSQKGDRARMATQQHEGKENVYRRSTLFTRSLIIRKTK